MSQKEITDIIILIILILLSGFFSSAETALTTVSQVSLKTLADQGNTRAKTALNVLSHHSKMLSAILIGNNVVNLSSSALCTSLIIRLFGSNAVTIATAILTVLIILFGEITPKNMATLRAQELSLAYAPIIQVLMTVLTPVIFIIDALANGILKIMHIDPNQRKHITESELRTYVEVGREDGVIENREKRLIYNVFDFGDSVAKDIMTPRVDMCCINIHDSYKEVMKMFREDMFTRLPVYDKDPDHIIGVINIKDFILIEDREKFSVADYLRDAMYTYEYKKTADLLKEMQGKAVNICFVLDEYGYTVGMITLEDLVEEIVGEIRDEYDANEEQQIHRYDDTTYLVEGSMKLDDINDALGSHFESEDYDSIAGLMIEKLERLPHNNEVVTLEDGTTLQAKGLQKNRIVKVLIRFHEAPHPETDEDTKPSADNNNDEDPSDYGYDE